MINFLIILTLWANVKCEHDKEKLKEFERLIGKPNIYYDEDNNLVLLVKIHKGPTNRIVDSGIESVGVQLKKCENSTDDSELVQFLSKLLSIDEISFKVTQGEGKLNRIVKITGSVVKPYEVIDKLVDALEMTAKQEPSALQVHDQSKKQSNEITNSESKEDPIRVFDWRDKFQE